MDEFDVALAKARASTDKSNAITWYQNAVEVYKGEYLQNLYYEWVFPERRRAAQAYMSALQELITHFASDLDPKLALRYFEKAMQIDNLNESLYCQAMLAYANLGNRSGIVSIFQQLKELLHQELDSEPLARTSQLYQELLENFATNTT
jgi:DNA-binding SARP family transcriptional activator